MKRQSNDANTISSGTNVRLPIGLIAGIVVGAVAFLYAQIELHHRESQQKFNTIHRDTEQKFVSVYEFIERKSSKEATEYKKQVEQRFQDTKEKNDAEHRSLQRQLDTVDREVNFLKRKKN